MKTRHFLLPAITLAALSFASPLHAHPSTKTKKRAQLVALIKDPELSKAACDEMMKDRANKRYMAQVVARDAEARGFYAAEVGGDAPHEERNPSEHPELFRANKP